MNTQDSHLTAWIKQWVLTQKLPSDLSVEPLAGDGSARRFYRLRAPDQTYVLLFDHHWSFSKDYPAHQVFLAKHGIPVPHFRVIDAEAGCLIMEDLGDELLQYRILAEPEKKMVWLREATKLLALLHGKTFPVPADLPAATRSFDKQKFLEEFLFTEEHLIKKYLKLSGWKDTDRRLVEDYSEKLGGIGPPVFAHRDYHTRNLLVKNGSLYMIDFQDARLGSPHYDLASLLWDPYVPVSKPEKEELTALYLQEAAKFPKLSAGIARDRFHTDLAFIAFQRVVKAAGSFASFFTRFGKETHLPYLRPALDSALDLQESIPALQSFRSAFPVAVWRNQTVS